MALYRDLLGQPATADSALRLLLPLRAGLPRHLVAGFTAGLPAARVRQVRQLAQRYLDQAPAPVSFMPLVRSLNRPGGHDVLARFLASGLSFLPPALSGSPAPTAAPLDSQAPLISILRPDVGQTTRRNVTVAGQVTDDLSGTAVLLAQVDTGAFTAVPFGASGNFTFPVTLPDGEHTVRLQARDHAGNTATAAVSFTVDSSLPPDPTATAPVVDLTVATNVAAATQFLYTGDDPVQTGVSPGTIEERRAAVLRGLVTDRDGAPLSGVAITVLDHPEFGQTRTRADGMFDLAVNGGGLLTVNYSREGYLPVQRQVEAPWQDYAWLPDVVLIPQDGRVTAIDLTADTPLQVAQGSVVTDADGTRQATLLFPQGTQATLVMADGTTQPLTTLHVRASEYTIGENGPRAMPGELPPTSGYTYAVELSADEAVAAGAVSVQFSQPVPFYVENFLGFPVGGIVPAGYYDRVQGVWVASANGRVIQVVSEIGGLADVDIDGNGTADGPTALAALGITDAEREQLAILYEPGQGLWRVPIPHFTPWDCNWPYSPPDDATPPNQPPPQGGNDPTSDPDNDCGSIIDVQNQALGEAVGIAGTPFSLHYQSDRTPGYDTRTLTIPLTGASLPADLRAVTVEVQVAGSGSSGGSPPSRT